VPQRDDRRVPAPYFQAADIRAVNAHSLGELFLREVGSKAKPPHVRKREYEEEKRRAQEEEWRERIKTALERLAERLAPERQPEL
jgi:hypothetical protein